jgi:hypothetical protein
MLADRTKHPMLAVIDKARRLVRNHRLPPLRVHIVRQEFA